MLVAGQDDVDVEVREHSQQVTGIGDDVALPSGSGDRHEMVMDGEQLDVAGLVVELLSDPGIAFPPDVPLVQVRLG